MRQCYSICRATCILLLLFALNSLPGMAQCPNGQAPRTLSFDTTENLFSGNDASIYTFPKFNPALGTLIAVEITARITGVVRLRLENDEIFPASYRVRYSRVDRITGPGLGGSGISNSLIKNYGPYNLATTDGNVYSGPDYTAVGPDTVLNNFGLSRTLTTGLLPFLGSGTVSYNYSVSAGTTVTGGSNYLFSVATYGRVLFRITYTYCPVLVLPNRMVDFRVKNQGGRNLLLEWKVENEAAGNQYGIEASRDGQNYFKVDRLNGLPAAANGTTNYNFRFKSMRQDGRKLYFRIKQTDVSSQSAYSQVESAQLDEEPAGLGAKVYPNPARAAFTVQLAEPLTTRVQVTLVSLSGRIVFSRVYELAAARLVNVALPQPPPAGTYLLMVKDIVYENQSTMSVQIR